jgi:hypothetical protein
MAGQRVRDWASAPQSLARLVVPMARQLGAPDWVRGMTVRAPGTRDGIPPRLAPSDRPRITALRQQGRARQGQTDALRRNTD